MAIITLKRAERTAVHVLIGLVGESGSGKTYSALHLARGLVGPAGTIAVLDTETGRALVYSSVCAPWDHAELTAPFTPERYVEAIQVIEAAGYDCLIIDSASHEWEGIGGVVESADASGKQGLLKWAAPKAQHKRFMRALLNSRMHVIVCLRAKEKLEAWEQTGDGKWRLAGSDRAQLTNGSIVTAAPQKVMKKEIVSTGFVGVQDKRFVYEMTVQLLMQNGEGRRGSYVIDKCPADLLGAFPVGKKISTETGERVAEWVRGGVPVDQELAARLTLARETAEKGMAALKGWWESLTPAQKAPLTPELANLKSIATEADRMAAEIAAQSTEEVVDQSAPLAPEPPADETFATL